MDRKTFFTLAGLVLVAVLSRVLPHPHNFAPIGAAALFSAAYFRSRRIGFAVPLLALFLSDLFLNNVTYAAYHEGFVWVSPGFYWVYGAFALIATLGWFTLRTVSAPRVAASSVAASLLFFGVSNFGVWAGSTMYPQTIEGLMACYAAGVPFIWNTLAGDLVYSASLFGAAYWVRSRTLAAA